MRKRHFRSLLFCYYFVLHACLIVFSNTACHGQGWEKISASFPQEHLEQGRHNITSIARGPSGYVASINYKMIYSTDLQNWAITHIHDELAAQVVKIYRVVYFGQYFAVGSVNTHDNLDKTVPHGCILHSSNGRDWKKTNVLTKGTVLDVVRGGNEYVATIAANEGCQLLYSSDGFNWSIINSGISGGVFRRILHKNGKYWLVWANNRFANSRGLLGSTNGLDWTSQELPNSVAPLAYRGILAIGNGTIVLVGLGGSIATNDGNGWELKISGAAEHLWDVAFRSDGFYGVGESGTIFHSINGKLWIPQRGGLNLPPLNAVVAYEDEVLAVGKERTILRRTSFSVPVIQTQPEDLSVSVGQDVEFAVDVEGPEGMTMQWIKDGVHVSGATEPILPIEEVSLSDAGEYWFEISSVNGITSTDKVVLSVNEVFIPPSEEHAFVFRSISSGTPGAWIDVQLNAVPEAGVSVYAIEDGPPSNWTVRNISGSGAFDADSGRVKFGPFFDANARTLSYEVLVPVGLDPESPEPFVGIASADGSKSPIGGDHFLSIGQTHPADLDGDFRLEIGEATGYGAAWKKSESWDRPPNPIPINYATHAGFLWKNGERYRHDASAGDPPLIWVSESVNSSAIGLASLSAGVAKRFRNDKEVKIQIFLPHNTSSYAVQERLPFDVKVVDLNEEGVWDPDSGVIRWGPFLDRKDRVLHYSIEQSQRGGKPSGFLSVDGESLRILDGARNGNDVDPEEGNADIAPSALRVFVDRNENMARVSWFSSIDMEYRILELSSVEPADSNRKQASEWMAGSGKIMEFLIPMGKDSSATTFFILEARNLETSSIEKTLLNDTDTTSTQLNHNLATPTLFAIDESGSTQTTQSEDVFSNTMSFASPAAIRELPSFYIQDELLTVQIDVTPAEGASVYAVEDRPLAGWEIVSIDETGTIDPRTGIAKFGPFFDAQPRILTYSVRVPVSNEELVAFDGLYSSDGVDVPIAGDYIIRKGIPHPADLNLDLRLDIDEATAYGKAWKTNEDWPRSPNPVPVDYATNAGFLWKNGEAYTVDYSTDLAPAKWVNRNGRNQNLEVQLTDEEDHPEEPVPSMVLFTSGAPDRLENGQSFMVDFFLANPAGELLDIDSPVVISILRQKDGAPHPDAEVNPARGVMSEGRLRISINIEANTSLDGYTLGIGPVESEVQLLSRTAIQKSMVTTLNLQDTSFVDPIQNNKDFLNVLETLRFLSLDSDPSWDHPFGGMPHRISGTFGEWRGKGNTHVHKGLDLVPLPNLPNVSGFIPILASKGGVVSRRGFLKKGEYLVVDHGDGWFSRYLHLDGKSISVKVGQTVARGDTLATRLFGNHLHFEIRQAKDVMARWGVGRPGDCLDPLQVEKIFSVHPGHSPPDLIRFGLTRQHPAEQAFDWSRSGLGESGPLYLIAQLRDEEAGFYLGLRGMNFLTDPEDPSTENWIWPSNDTAIAALLPSRHLPHKGFALYDEFHGDKPNREDYYRYWWKWDTSKYASDRGGPRSLVVSGVDHNSVTNDFHMTFGPEIKDNLVMLDESEDWYNFTLRAHLGKTLARHSAEDQYTLEVLDSNGIAVKDVVWSGPRNADNITATFDIHHTEALYSFSLPANIDEESFRLRVTSQLMPDIAHEVAFRSIGNCGDEQVAGGDLPDSRFIDLGKKSGNFIFEYETYSQEDRIIVSYEGNTLFDTGCVGENGSRTLSFSGNSTRIRIQVIPNCQGGTGTSWDYKVNCLE